MEPITEETKNYDQMVIVEKYERVVSYLYPIAQNMPRKHSVARDMFLTCMFTQTDMFYQAGKSNQVSKIYAADANLAQLRFWLRFLVSIRCMTPHQLQTAQVLIAEVGGMLNAWARKRADKGQAGK